MSMQIHLVVQYDTEEKRFFIDNETTDAVMPDGVVYDVKNDFWDVGEEAEELERKTYLALRGLLEMAGKVELDA